MIWSYSRSGISMDSCSSSDRKNSWNRLAVLCLLVFIHSKGICWVLCVDHGAVDPEMEDHSRLQGTQVRPGGGTVVIRRLGNSQLASSQALLSASSQHLLSLGFLLLQQKRTFYSVPTSGRLQNTSAVFKTQ